MTISYKWLCEYLPVMSRPDPERLSRILTSIGLEVEHMKNYEEVKGGLKGLVIGEVLSTEKHPNADKLTLTKVDIGNGQPLQIVCGAPNVASGQKVIVAPVGATIFPSSGEPLTMKVARIRSVESQGMICAEDEIGLGDSHAGIMVLPPDLKAGMAVADYLKPYEDTVYEIGLTPNRMDAMSHWGVARDVCAYLSHHDKKELRPKLPVVNALKPASTSLAISVEVENEKACPRYSGVSISNVKIEASPLWLQQRLKAIGVRPINNIVDITNFIQHETGQPLHAFDADKIRGRSIIVKNLPEGTAFVTLDEKKRVLSADDLMICDAEGPICIAGVFGGLDSGVSGTTANIFLESACFEPVTTRKTSFRQGLRTDAATRFEKGTDISATVTVLNRAAQMICELAGGSIASPVIDVYPDPEPKKEIGVKWHYIKKLTGKIYHPDAVRNILSSLGFEWIKEGVDEFRVAVPYHKPDVALPADVAEEILRIDGLDNVDIPGAITITPSIEENYAAETYREKVSTTLVGLGFREIMTNSITNAAYYSEEEQTTMVKMLNSLSAELNILRNSLFETALEVVAHNLNHRNTNLRLFEFGKAYNKTAPGKFQESEKCCLVITGMSTPADWRRKAVQADLFYLKGIVLALFKTLGIHKPEEEKIAVAKLDDHFIFRYEGEIIAGLGEVKKTVLQKFGIKQPVWFAGLNWQSISKIASRLQPLIQALPKFPSVQRDIAMVVSSDLHWETVRSTVERLSLKKLSDVRLFDVFESEKLGAGKKSIAVNFTFIDTEKTLTDKEIDGWMKSIMERFEKDLHAEIRK
jgi:phenylalanyl-tRNA synthetase beta chain